MGLKQGLLAGVLLLLLAAQQGASAQTIGYAEAHDRIAHSCGSDIERYCGNVALGGGAIKACLERNQAKISGQCRTVSAEAFDRKSNLVLSQKRAEAVRDALVTTFGIAPGRVVAVGLGEEQLQDRAHPDEAVNRRVQMVNLGRFR